MNKFKRFIATLIVAFFFAPIVGVQASVESANGIDISNYQTIQDYQGLKDSGVDYTYIKATEGTGYKDTKLDTHFTGCYNANIKVGFYHFMSEWSDPSDQATSFYEAIKYYNYSLIPVLDVETNSRFFSQEQLSYRVIQFANKFRELSGQNIIIYSGSYFSRTYFNDTVIANYPLWVAHYYVDKPTIPDSSTLVGHQFTDRYFIDNQYVDGNVFTSAIELNSSDTKTIESVNTSFSTSIATSQFARYSAYVGSRCKELQELLNKQGYSLIVDGDYGELTHRALGDFQGKNNLTVDFMAGGQTFNALRSNNNWVYKLQANIGAVQDNVAGKETLSKCPTLKRGNNSNTVKLLQEKLGISADGIFGNETYNAIVNYQKSKGLTPDGIIGQLTWRKLLGV